MFGEDTGFLMMNQTSGEKMNDDNKHLITKMKGIPTWMVAAVDICLVNLSFYLAFTLRFTGQVPDFNIEPFTQMVPWLSILTVILFGALGLYSRQRNGFTPVLRTVITAAAVLTLSGIAIAFWTRGFAFPRTVFAITPLLLLLLLLGWRILHWRLDLWIHGQKKLLVIGHPEEVRQTLDKILMLPRGMFEVVKVLDPAMEQGFSEWLSDVEAVMITGSMNMELKNRVIRESFSRGVEVFVVPDLYEIILTRAYLTQVHDTPVIECRDMQLSFLQAFTKRMVDLLIATVITLVTWPLLVGAYIVVRFSSPGPVVYSQERVGYDGRIFTLYKFRTMVHNAEEKSGPVFATEDDDRVTPVGRFLRAARLDELPQLVNVLKGDLSIVGPRPERPFFVEQFSRDIPEYYLRQLVKPGITGMAQVAGHYATDTRDKLRFDLFYISDYSLFLDLKILLLTIPTLFNRAASRGVKPGEKKQMVNPDVQN